jgi:type IV secretory pathway TraG/TraD family ATPase VirD4
VERLVESFDWFTHGWHAGVGAWLVVTVGMWAGLWLRGANNGRFLTAPIAAAVVAVFALLAAAALKTGLAVAGISGLLPAYGAFTVFPLFGLLAGLLSSSPAHAVLHRGTVIQDGKPLQRRGRRRRAGQLTLAGIAVPPLDETKHFKMLGTTGTGKSTAIRELIGGALARGDRAVIADPDGGYLARFYDPERGDVILNPFDPRAHRWAIYGELNEPHDVEQLARSLIPDHDGPDRTWRAYARTFVTAITRQTFDAGVRDFSELYRLLTVADSDELRILVGGTLAQPFLESGNERMFGSIRSVTGSALSAFEYLWNQQGPPLAVRDWVRERRGVMFLPYRADQIAALRSIISAWLRLAIFQCMSEGEGDKRMWFVVDELDALGPVDGLKDALARLRKFGGRCVLGFQSIAQVSSTYGHGEAQTIVENCSNSLILRCSSSENGGTARFASKLIGEREVIRPTVSKTRRSGFFTDPHHSVSRGEQHVTEVAVLPAQIEQLPDLSGYLKFASQPAWLRVQLPPP